MSELEKIETAVEGEAKKVEVAVETKAEEVEKAAVAVEGEVKTVAGEVAKETKEVTTKLEEKAKAITVEIGTDEKLYLREAELEYLKAQMQIQSFQKIIDTKTTEYRAYVDGLMKKYGLSKAEYVLDGAVNIFRKL